MPKPTFYNLIEERRNRLITETIAEFSDKPYKEASLSKIALRARIPKGSIYQYFEDKIDLYRWLMVEEVPRQKRAFVGAPKTDADFWSAFENFVERGMAFLVAHPRLARLASAAADPSSDEAVRGLHKAICDAGIAELRAFLEMGAKEGELDIRDMTHAVSFVASVVGPGLTAAVLHTLGCELHEVLASDSLRQKLTLQKRRKLARQAILFIRNGIGTPK